MELGYTGLGFKALGFKALGFMGLARIGQSAGFRETSLLKTGRHPQAVRWAQWGFRSTPHKGRRSPHPGATA